MILQITEKLALQYPIPKVINADNPYWVSGWSFNIWLLTANKKNKKQKQKGIGEIERRLGFVRWRK